MSLFLASQSLNITAAGYKHRAGHVQAYGAKLGISSLSAHNDELAGERRLYFMPGPMDF